MEKRTILFYDGVCGLCDQTVQFLLEHAKPENLKAATNEKLYFTPLQGETAKALLNERDRAELSTLVLLENGIQYRRAQAIQRLSKFVQTPWNLLLSSLHWVPAPVSNWGYNIVARYRYQVFGQSESCRLPRPEERAHFLP